MNKDYKEQYREETGEELFYTYSVPPSNANKYVAWLEKKLDDRINPKYHDVDGYYTAEETTNE